MLDYLVKHKAGLIYLPLAAYWIVLLIATSLPGNDLPDIAVSDKIEHFTAYFILAVLLNTALFYQEKFPKLKNRSSLTSIIVIGCYAALDELHQLYIPGRSCDIKDWTADIAAALFGILIMRVVLKKSERKPFKI